jgi:acetyl esterase/lipase
MPSSQLLHPDFIPLLEQLPDFSFEGRDIATTRELLAALGSPAPPIPDDVESFEARTPGRDGAPEVRLVVTRLKKRGMRAPGILHVHGGGYVLGAADMTVPLDAMYAREFGATCVSVDYRLAPETRFPGSVEDCYAGLLWLYENAAELGVDANRIIVSGESAGGGLAAALALLARDRGRVPIAFQHLVYPMLDDRTVVQPDPCPHVGQYIWTREHNRFGWASLLGHEPGSQDVSPYAAPARAEDLSGLPPTFIAVGSLDLFLEENLEYARGLIRAGVSTELHVYAGAPHGFQMIIDAEASRAFGRDSMAALARAALSAAAG